LKNRNIVLNFGEKGDEDESDGKGNSGNVTPISE